MFLNYMKFVDSLRLRLYNWERARWDLSYIFLVDGADTNILTSRVCFELESQQRQKKNIQGSGVESRLKVMEFWSAKSVD